MSRVAPILDATGKFPRKARVRRRREFTQVHDTGIRVQANAFTVLAAHRSSGDRARLGLTVSRRVGNAVVRNRVRRLLKEIFRRRASTLGAVDVVIIARPSAAVLAKQGLQAVAADVVPAIDAAAQKLSRLSKPTQGGAE